MVGRHLEGACLLYHAGRFDLYLVPPSPEMELWSGPARTLAGWEQELEVPTHPLDELMPPAACATLPVQDEETASFLSVVLDRDVEAQSGPTLKGIDASLAEAMVALRLTQDVFALEQLRFAAQISAHAHRVGMQVTAGVSREAQVRAAMEGCILATGMSCSYNPIVTVHGEILHAERSDGVLHSGELLLCDVGAESPEGLAGDVTRTWPVSGRFSPTQRDAYELILEVQTRAIRGAQVGVRFGDLHVQALAHLAEGLVNLGIARCSPEQCLESGLAAVFFPHGLGHLLGLDVHDMEDLGDRAGYGEEGPRDEHPAYRTLRLGRTLRKDMVVTIEPGFYQVPHLLQRALSDQRTRDLLDTRRLGQFADVRGIRIEDDVWIGADGPQVLSHEAPKGVAELESFMSGE